MCFCQLYTRDISNSNSFDVLCKHARACRLSENDRLLFVRFKQRDARQAEPKIGSREDTGRSRTRRQEASTGATTSSSARCELDSQQRRRQRDAEAHRVAARTKKEDHRNGSTMQLPVDLRVRTRPEKKNSSVIQLPVDLRVRTRPPEKKNGSVIQLPVDLRVRTRPPEKKNSSVKQLPVDLRVKTQQQGGRSNNKIQLPISKLELIHSTELWSSRLTQHVDNRYVQAHTQALGGLTISHTTSSTLQM